MKSKDKKPKKYKNVCPNCSSQNIKKDGLRKTLYRGKIQRYKCKNCNYRFVKDNGFFRMRNNEKKITLCLDLYFRGVSTRKIQEHLEAFYPNNSSWVSIYYWIIKYSNMISEFTNKLKLDIGSEIQVDEMEFRTKGKQCWFVDIIDTKTRFMVYSNYTKAREKKEFKKMFNLVNNKTQGNIKKVTTDGFKLHTNVVNEAIKELEQWLCGEDELDLMDFAILGLESSMMSDYIYKVYSSGDQNKRKKVKKVLKKIRRLDNRFLIRRDIENV